MDRQATSLARRPDPGQRVRRAAVQGPPARRHRHRQYLRGLHPLARRGRRPADRGREGRPDPRHRAGQRLRGAHPGEGGCMTAQLTELPGQVPVTAGAYDLAARGYVEQEFRLDGTAESYRLTAERGPDGQWPVQADEPAPFVTRLLLRRPVNAADFSGTVVVEWLNVSGGLDAAPDWMLAHTYLLRHGHAWVGVSAQRAGIEGGGMVEGMHLKVTSPERYAALSHPGDRWAFDIFSQAGRAVLARPGLLPRDGNGPPVRMLACGHSQSGSFLTTYVNAVDPVAGVYDGFLVHGRPGVAASLDTGFNPAGLGGAADRIRDDLRVPVIVLQTDTDVALLVSGRVSHPERRLLRNSDLPAAAST